MTRYYMHLNDSATRPLVEMGQGLFRNGSGAEARHCGVCWKELNQGQQKLQVSRTLVTSNTSRSGILALESSFSCMSGETVSEAAPIRKPATPPALLAYSSIAELYQFYLNEFVSKSPIDASCGCKIHCYEHHFIHMIKLNGPQNERLWFPDEKPVIIATREGFGKYSHDTLRARRLRYALECLRNPDKVFRPVRLRTADRAYIKEFGSASLPYPFTVVLVRKEEQGLTLCTAQPVKRGDIRKWEAGDLLWPKTPQPPARVAV